MVAAAGAMIIVRKTTARMRLKTMADKLLGDLYLSHPRAIIGWFGEWVNST
jgi:hypothetical protein